MPGACRGMSCARHNPGQVRSVNDGGGSEGTEASPVKVIMPRHRAGQLFSARS